MSYLSFQSWTCSGTWKPTTKRAEQLPKAPVCWAASVATTTKPRPSLLFPGCSWTSSPSTCRILMSLLWQVRDDKHCDQLTGPQQHRWLEDCLSELTCFVLFVLQTQTANPKWSVVSWQNSLTTSVSPWMLSSSCSSTTWCQLTWRKRRKVLLY